ncbi:pyroglutamyl-peptidase I [Labrys sp. WJW]|uniref:pyroglutamyl-peptidase I n=1 Tax=Labrys sp. WJW TaxID=1737983 RepID=UPI000836CB10|nr:pyroglutamyl-peptidase I [Labrys sp. WJW]OCC04970.1 pyroglutamyl-peptidase I [Labrys sp. WJW]
MSPKKPPDQTPPTVLITGFEAFENDETNASWEVARALDGWICEGALVRAVQLPCVFGAAIERLDEALRQWRPRLVISLGQASGRAEITPERVAINLDDARIADNDGRQPIDIPVISGAPAAYFSSLPVKAIVRDLRSAGLPASLSNTAGTFVCNHVFFALMHRLATHRPLAGTRGGFVHMPCLPEHAARRSGLPSLALATQVEAIRYLTRTALTVQDDVRESGGQIH